MMSVENVIELYEIDGKECFPPSEERAILIKNHWNYNDWVVICVGDKEYTVSARDLKKAIDNSTNWK